MLCAPVMEGDYLAMQGLDEFSSTHFLQARHPSHTSLPRSLWMFIIYVTPINYVASRITMALRLRDEYKIFTLRIGILAECHFFF